MQNTISSNPKDAFILAQVNGEVITEQNSGTPLVSASLIKLLYANEILSQIESGKLSDDPILITPDMVSKYGTNVLGDLVNGKNQISLSPSSLTGLMIKYSCNSSSSILRKYLSDDLISDTITLKKLREEFEKVYADPPKLQTYNDFLKNELKTSRNIYYLFDQLGVNVLGSKSGTLQKDGVYWIGDSGVIEDNGQKYFIASIVSREKISDAVIEIRKIGKALVNLIRES